MTLTSLHKKRLVLLNKLRFFRIYEKPFTLAGIFNIPGNYGTATALDGLHTRDKVMQMVQNQVGAVVGNAWQHYNNSWISASTTRSIQGYNNADRRRQKWWYWHTQKFKPNNEKTKTFLKRLEARNQLQTTRSIIFFLPKLISACRSDIKLGKKGIAGIGVSYKVFSVGGKSDINHIQ